MLSVSSSLRREVGELDRAGEVHSAGRRRRLQALEQHAAELKQRFLVGGGPRERLGQERVCADEPVERVSEVAESVVFEAER